MFKLLENDKSEIRERFVAFNKRFGGMILYHGSTKRLDSGTKLNFRFRDKSKDTALIINAVVNDHLVQEYGLPIRNLLYTTQDASVASGYGELCIVIPAGNYNLYYSDGVGDFTDHFGVSGNDFLEMVLEQTINDFYNNEDIKIDGNELSQLIDDNYQTINKISTARSMEELTSLTDNAVAVDPDDTKKLRHFLEIFTEDLLYNIETQIIENYEITEINNGDDVPDTSTEIMAYFPDGFYVIKPDDMELYMGGDT